MRSSESFLWVGLVILIGSVVVPSTAFCQTQGYIDVYLNVPDDITPPDLAGYEVKLGIWPNNEGVTLLDALATDPYGAHPPVFMGRSPYTIPGSGDTMQATDYLYSGAEPIRDGQGLFRVLFAVEDGTDGTFQINLDPMFTNLSDETAAPIPFVGSSGEIIVEPGQAPAVSDVELRIIPEPATLSVLALGGLILARRKRRA